MKYDVFISAKSQDYDLAKEVYHFLTNNGLNPFLACITLDEEGKSQFGEAIDDALDDAIHMIVVASSLEHINASYVKSEWSTFNNDLRTGKKTGNLLTILSDNINQLQLKPALRYHEVLRFNNYQQKILKYLKVQTPQTPHETYLNGRQENTCHTLDSIINIPKLVESVLSATVKDIWQNVDKNIYSKALDLYFKDYISFKINSYDICPKAWELIEKHCEKHHKELTSLWAQKYEFAIKTSLLTHIKGTQNNQQWGKLIGNMPSFGMDICEELYKITLKKWEAWLNARHPFLKAHLANPKRTYIPIINNANARRKLLLTFFEQYEEDIRNSRNEEIALLNISEQLKKLEQRAIRSVYTALEV